MATLGPSDVSWAMPVLMFMTGMSFGFSMAPAQTAVLAATRPVPPDQAGYHLAFVVAAVTMAAGAVIASAVSDADAAPTMTPRRA
jgi:hypothetical protein